MFNNLRDDTNFNSWNGHSHIFCNQLDDYQFLPCTWFLTLINFFFNFLPRSWQYLFMTEIRHQHQRYSRAVVLHSPIKSTWSRTLSKQTSMQSSKNIGQSKLPRNTWTDWNHELTNPYLLDTTRRVRKKIMSKK